MHTPIIGQVTITPANSNDIDGIQQLAKLIWPVAYASILSETQLNYMLNLFYSLASLQQQMNDGHQFLIAKNNEQLIGFAGFSCINDTTFKLQKLYVLPTLQKTGTGKALLTEVEARVMALGGLRLLLNVNRQNIAIQFYEKQGFEVVATEDIDIGNSFFMNDFIMEKILGE